MKLRYSLLSTALFSMLSLPLYAVQGYYRSPVLQQDQLVFTAEGDLWQASINSSNARRLTSHMAEETQALISPDGTQLAFVADYDGASEIYLMPLSGGVAKRISYENSRVRIQQWLTDGRILYATDSAAGPANYWLLKTVDPQTLVADTLPLADAASGSIDEQGGQVFFGRFGIQLTGDNTKVYRGGAMGELWQWALGSKNEAVRLAADHNGNISQPVFYQGRVYFVSDADGNSNIWSVAGNGDDITQHSFHKDWRIGRISVSNGQVLYQLGADLQLLQLDNGQSRSLPLQIQSDLVQQRERIIAKPLQYFNSAHYHTQHDDSDKVVVTARSQLAVVQPGQQRLVQISTPAGSRSREAVLSKDGNWVYAINDHSGENEIWRFAADGSDNAKQLTSDGRVWRWQLKLSPDGEQLAHDDKNGDLWLLNLATGRNTKVYQGGIGLSGYDDINWSADSKLLSFTLNPADQGRSQVVLYSVLEQQSAVITSEKYDAFSPAFSVDGLWLYFISNRQLIATPGHPWGDRNLGPMFDKRSQVFAVSLKQQACFAFQPAQEVVSCDDAQAKTSLTAKKASRVDWNGISSRLWQVPVAAGNYQQLALNDKRLYVLDRDASVGAKPVLKQIEFSQTEAKAEVFASDVSDYQLAVNGKKLFMRKHSGQGAGDMYVVEAAAKVTSELNKAKLNVASWQLSIDPVEEWQQMFADGWRMHRDFLFDKGMRGLDWNASKAKYQPLLQRVTDRHELDDIFAQMMGELNVLHSQVRGGEYRADDSTAKAASLGAELIPTKGGLLIKHIYRTDTELPAQAAPLAKPGVAAKAGDIITAVNGQTVTTLASLTNLLRNQAGKPVLLNLTRDKLQWQTMVEPVSSGYDSLLRYQDWVSGNQQKVVLASDNQFGYLHLYAMGPNDIANFAREFYAHYDKPGLIIDVRRNRGGNIDSWIIEKLLRRAWAFWQPTQGAAYTNMQQAFRGHLVVLTDQLTYSDGETFAAGIKAQHLGPLIGKRTAGAGVWLSGRNRLADNGMARVAETAQFALDGRWIIEGYGVTPDIAVDNLPYAHFNGTDSQLERAIGYLQQQLQNQPVSPLKAQPLTTPIGADILP
ncbi:S41 family peptidase [Rheinheimera maricola]|uniref:Tricorn protease homolog n=1 Tax=Rheinheimera maricola TaxID=2793282 RepID=A0ABS7X7B4_9GAMM|nr:S41 family peptidase [Rheinheimera maricola]MBZ9611010.1 PDZ domain-containing protein [Rheinheimera maricola]